MTPLPEIVCSGCRCAYTRATWQQLSIVSTLTSRDLRPYVVAWEDSRVIEVRACATCGREMARAARRAA